jgi:cytochrome c553
MRSGAVVKLWGYAASVMMMSMTSALSGSGSAQADEARLKAYGQHLAGECTSCHRVDGVDNGVPSITGWPQDDFVATIKFYTSGARDNQVMTSVAGSLDDKQVAALAAYFGSLDRPPKKK